MTADPGRKDLVVLTADRSMKLGIEGLLARSKSLGIAPISRDVFAHPANDPGVLRKGHEFLRPQHRRYRYAIAMCDRDGCGKEHRPRVDLETMITEQLHRNGWENRAEAIVLDPELEIWIWGDWDCLASSIRWPGGGAQLNSWITAEQLMTASQTKPPRPKEALERALKLIQFPFSSAIHQAMAEQSSFAQCTDPAFLKLLPILQRWFPA